MRCKRRASSRLHSGSSAPACERATPLAAALMVPDWTFWLPVGLPQTAQETEASATGFWHCGQIIETGFYHCDSDSSGIFSKVFVGSGLSWTDFSLHRGRRPGSASFWISNFKCFPRLTAAAGREVIPFCAPTVVIGLKIAFTYGNGKVVAKVSWTTSRSERGDPRPSGPPRTPNGKWRMTDDKWQIDRIGLPPGICHLSLVICHLSFSRNCWLCRDLACSQGFTGRCPGIWYTFRSASVYRSWRFKLGRGWAPISRIKTQNRTNWSTEDPCAAR